MLEYSNNNSVCCFSVLFFSACLSIEMSLRAGSLHSRPPYPPAGGFTDFSIGSIPSQNPNFGTVNCMPTSKVELRLSCRNLPNMDILSKSDPFVVFYTQSSTQDGKRWVERGRTETIMDNLNPDFVKSFVLNYFFEMTQNLKFDVYDLDSSSHNLSDHDYIGSCECTLGSLLGEHRGSAQFTLKKNDTSRGTILLHAEEVNDCHDLLKLKFCAKGLDRKDFFGRSDPFLTLFRYNEDNSMAAVLKSEVIKNTLNPSWKTMEVSVQTLCNGDVHRPLKVVCQDWNRNGNHKLIGEFSTTVTEMKGQAQNPISFEAINPEKKKKKNYKNSGTITLERCEIETIPTFLDYIQSGMELCFSVAIDFTASNGNPSSPESLHYYNQYSPNQYVQALTAVGRICEDYDTDKLFPAYGFGAKLPPFTNVYHQFTLTGADDPHCLGTQGILEAYYSSLSRVQLYGPTNFAPVIDRVAQQASYDERHRPGKSYHVLLMITDGIITDIDQTKEVIVRASSLPMSLIIVGVGPADFDAMDELDGDDIRLSSRGRFAARDIVQFVPFRNFSGKGPAASQLLASEVLEELPDQVVSYMRSKNFLPGTRKT